MRGAPRCGHFGLCHPGPGKGRGHTAAPETPKIHPGSGCALREAVPQAAAAIIASARGAHQPFLARPALPCSLKPKRGTGMAKHCPDGRVKANHCWLASFDSAYKEWLQGSTKACTGCHTCQQLFARRFPEWNTGHESHPQAKRLVRANTKPWRVAQQQSCICPPLQQQAACERETFLGTMSPRRPLSPDLCTCTMSFGALMRQPNATSGAGAHEHIPCFASLTVSENALSPLQAARSCQPVWPVCLARWLKSMIRAHADMT